VTVIGGEFQKARNYEFVVNLVQFREESNKTVEVTQEFSFVQKIKAKITQFWLFFAKIPVDFSEETENNSKTLNRKYFFYKSLVYPKQDKPKWNEIVNVIKI
jgi:hypothetical protein